MRPAPSSPIFVVVPTYNEAQNLPSLLSRLYALDASDLRVLVVDDASPDGTGRLADQLVERYHGHLHVLHREGKLGLASAYHDGYRTALDLGAAIVAQMDADLSHPPEVLPDLIAPIQREEADVVIGSRYVPGGSTDSRWSLPRLLLSRGGNLYSRLVLGLPLKDATSGFRAFRRETLSAALQSPFRCRGFGFQIEVAFLCWQRGYRIKEVPFRFAQRDTGKSKISAQIVLEALARLPQLRLSYALRRRKSRVVT